MTAPRDLPDRVLDDSRIVEDRATGAGKAAVAERALRCGPLIAQAGTPAAAPGPVNTRTVFIVQNDVVADLPQLVIDRVVAEVQDVFAFVGGQQNQTAMSVRLIAPDRFPEAFNFSDAVVSVIAKSSSLTPHLNTALRQQRRNAVRTIRALGVRVADPTISGRSAAVPDRFGIATAHKVVVQAGNQRLAIPLMVAVVGLDTVIAEVASHFGSGVNEQAIRTRRAQTPLENPAYWASAQSLKDTQALMVLDNPQQPAQWPTRVQESAGRALGRVIAHEARHLYLAPHAVDGLGSESAILLGSLNDERFSSQDEADILAAIHHLEANQVGAVVVATYPQDARDEDFPF